MIKATDLKIEYLTGNPTIDIVSPKIVMESTRSKDTDGLSGKSQCGWSGDI